MNTIVTTGHIDKYSDRKLYYNVQVGLQRHRSNKLFLDLTTKRSIASSMSCTYMTRMHTVLEKNTPATGRSDP